MSVVIDLIRHGEPEGGSRYRGHSVDDPLSEKGWMQMRSAITDDMQWDSIVSSPLIRCLDFANEVAKNKQIDVQTIDDLKEIGFGRWEGKSRSIVKALHAREYALFYADPEKNTPVDAEPLGVFYRRVMAVIKEIVQRYDGQHILLVAHAGVIRAILTYALDAPLNSMYKMNVKNAALVRVEFSESNMVYF